MLRSWRAYLVVVCVALCWLGVAFVVLPRLGDPTSFSTVVPTSPSSGEAQTSVANNQVTARNFRGNVYHIILDSYQSEAFQYFLAKTPELGQLPFTYYPNFKANSPMTYFSAAELFASDFYTPGILPENWHNAAFQGAGMEGFLANIGIRLHLYTRYPEYCYDGEALATCKTAAAMEADLQGGSGIRQTTIDLWFLKLIPTTLKRKLDTQPTPIEDTSDGDSHSNWDYGFSLLNAINPGQGPRGRDKSYFSVQQFMQFLDDEDSRPATGQYVFFHAILPHGPFAVDSQCNFVRETERPLSQQESYLQQVQCTHKLIALLVKKLSDLGRLDNSLIIVHGDHGYYWHPADLGVLYEYKPLDVSAPRVAYDDADSSTWPSEMVETRASTLLLIKFPGQTTASRSDKPAQMIDIAPTILRYFGIDAKSLRGMSIQDMPDSLVRDRFFLVSNRVPEWRNPKVFSRYRYVDGKWRFEENITTLANTDQFLFTLGPAQ